MQLPGYSDIQRFSQGGMSTVYTAIQDSLQRKVAIKLLSAELHHDESARQFFDQESRVVASLNHPNIIKIIDRGFSQKGRPFFVMEYVEGQELSELSQSKNLPPATKVQIMMQVCRAVSFAHKNGIVHRDIKPANVLIDKEGHVRILDFGIAWLKTSGNPNPQEIVGTPDYMSPEQFNNPEAISPASDIYSLGAMMFQLFTGRLPAEHINDLAKPLRGMPQELSALILQCLEIDPAKRPQSADELSFRLIRTLRGAHIKSADKQEAQAALGSNADKFNLLDVLKRSRFSSVYLFEDTQRQRLFVVKKRSDSESGFEQSKQLKSIAHEHIIGILGTSKNNKSFIVVMEYLSGGSLQDRLSRKFTLARFVKSALEICDALSTAHQHAVFHGDLRPSNILFDDKDTLKISDFGFARHYQESNQERDWYQPEGHKALDASRDIFSAGVIFYQMLTGELPVVRYAELKPGKEFQQLDPALQTLLSQMINQQAVERVQNFEAVKQQLLKLKIEKPKPTLSNHAKASHLKWWIAAFVLLNLSLGAYLFLR